MPRTYKRKTERASYLQEDLQRALAAIGEGAALKSTAKAYGISPRTLRRHRDGKVARPGSIVLGRFRPDINETYEADLVAKIQEMEAALFGLTTKDVRRLAYDFANQMGIKHRFNKDNKMAGYDWLNGFMSRHPELSIRKPEAMNIARAVGFNRPQVQKFFDAYREVLTSHEYSAARIWNMDETGVSNVQKPGNIIATKGAREVGKMTSGEKGKTVTVICATNAVGNYIPPMFIFPRKRMVDTLMNNAPAGAIGHCTESGWTDERSFLKWLKHFCEYAKPSVEEKHVLILDGHHSHKTLAAVEFARANGIVMITLPPHCTHKMQPLDKTFFKGLKNAYNTSADTWMVANQGKRISFYDIAGIFAIAYNRSATVEKSVNGFRVCGLWPFNDQVFTDEDFIPAALTDEPQPNQEGNFQRPLGTEVAETEVHPNQENAQQPYTPADGLGTDDVGEQPPPNEHPIQVNNQQVGQAPSGPATGPTVAAIIHAPAKDHDIPSTSSAGSLSLSGHNTPSQTVLSQLCKPVKSLTKRKRTRKTERAEVLTSSPYKKTLEEKSKKTKVKRQRKTKTADGHSNKKQGKRLNQIESSSDEDEEWPCLVCGELFHNSKPGENWIQCTVCLLWAHEECTPGERGYICQNCDSDDSVD